MRGIGDPRAISILARLPEKGLRGCTVLAPNVFQRRSSYSGAGRGGAGRGIGSADESDGASFGRGRATGRGFPQVEIEEQQQRNDYLHGSASGRFTESRDGDPAEIRVGAVQQQGGVAAGRGRGIPFALQQQRQVAAREDESVSSVVAERFGKGKVVPESQPAPPPPPPPQGRAGSVSRGMPLGGNVDLSKQDIGSSGDDKPQQIANLGQARIDQGSSNSDPLPSTDEPKLSAVEQLLAKLGHSPFPKGSPAPQSSVSAGKPKLPFRMPFARRPPAPEQQQPVPAPSKPIVQAQAQAQTPVPLLPLGRGRGQPSAVTQPGIGVEAEAAETSPRRDDRMLGRAKQGAPPRPPSPPRMQLSVEEARARAIAILEKGIEKNLAAEGERRRKGGMDKFADATEFLTDRFKRAPGQSSSQPQRSRDERQRPSAVSRRSDRPRRQRQGEEMVGVAESREELQLTPEQEAELVRIQEEDTFKDRLHTLFLAQFEPEFAMEEFGRNPDIDEPPVLSLEDYLQSHKSLFLPEDAELSAEQKWQEAVKTSLANASNLEKLVEAYAGRGRITAQQQIAKLQTIHQKLPSTVAPEVAAFSQRAFLTLQNNPRLNMYQKEKLMTNIVSGFSTS